MNSMSIHQNDISSFLGAYPWYVQQNWFQNSWGANTPFLMEPRAFISLMQYQQNEQGLPQTGIMYVGPMIDTTEAKIEEPLLVDQEVKIEENIQSKRNTPQVPFEVKLEPGMPPVSQESEHFENARSLGYIPVIKPLQKSKEEQPKLETQVKLEETPPPQTNDLAITPDTVSKISKLTLKQRKHFFQHFLILLRSYLKTKLPADESRRLVVEMNLTKSNNFSKRFFLTLLKTELGFKTCEELILSDTLLEFAVRGKKKYKLIPSTLQAITDYYPSVKELITHRGKAGYKFKWKPEQNKRKVD